MSDYKNALDSYKKAAGKKTENTGFEDIKLSSKDNKHAGKKLPDHLKKSLKDADSLSSDYMRKSSGNRSEKLSEKIIKQNNESANPPKNRNMQNNRSEKNPPSPISPERFIFHQLEEKKNDQYFIKETVSADSDLENIKDKADHKGNKYTESGLNRVAKLLALLGKEEAANVLKSFSPSEVERIAGELVKIKQIGKDEASELLKIIHKKNTKNEIFAGGVEKARDILKQAFGDEKGEELLKKSLPEKREKPFEFLNDIEAVQIKLAVKNESTTITAIILSHLKPEKSASLLKEYSPEEQKDIILKMSQKGKIGSEIVEKIENGLKKRIREQGNIVTREIDGKNRLAGILRFMDPDEEERILEELTEDDPDLSKEIDSRIFNIDIVHDIPDRDFQKILNDFSEQEIALILKGRSSRIKKKFAKNISQQRKELIHRESEFIGIVRKSEVNKATTEFIDYIRQFEKEGKIIINRGGNLFI